MLNIIPVNHIKLRYFVYNSYKSLGYTFKWYDRCVEIRLVTFLVSEKKRSYNGAQIQIVKTSLKE